MELYAFSNVFILNFSENNFKYSFLLPPNGGPTSVNGNQIAILSNFSVWI